MTYLPPLNRNNSEIFANISNQSLNDLKILEACSGVSSHISDKAFSDSTISNMKAWALSNMENRAPRVKAMTNIAITAITCTAIACLPKVVALGCIVVSVFTYRKFAKVMENKENDLLLTRNNLETVNFLSSPDLNKKVLGVLQPYKNDYFLKEIQPNLEGLEESPEKTILMEKKAKILANQKKIDETLFYLKTKGLLGSLEKESISTINLENTLKFLRDHLDTSRLDLLLEDLNPLINDINENNCILREIKEILEALEGGSFFKKDFWEMNTVILRRQERLSKKLNALQVNGLFFKENKDLLNTIIYVFLRVHRIIVNEARNCQHFMFYSLTGTALIKSGCFLLKEVLSKNKLVDKGMTLTQYTAYPFLLFGLVGVAMGYFYLLQFLSSDEKNEPRECMGWERFSEEEKTNLHSFLEQA
jgi:hypothetical protein